MHHAANLARFMRGEGTPVNRKSHKGTSMNPFLLQICLRRSLLEMLKVVEHYSEGILI